jgi:benzoyl-CoA reductase/2-hydroxyglutaryl-CoA dehydratase subunit BcrC/BadD/HgdB
MPRQRYNELLRELLDELSAASAGITDYRARLMIVGGILDDPAYLRVIEDLGALVVTDSLCFGSRILWEDVDEEAGGDPIAVLARYQLMERPSCPRMFGTHLQRIGFVERMIKDFNVDGVIGERLMFCDYWTGEHFMLNREYKKMGIPSLELDREYILAGVGQLRTRVQAFLESIESPGKSRPSESNAKRGGKNV